jgi:uncharacterized protein (TIGR02246 family)
MIRPAVIALLALAASGLSLAQSHQDRDQIQKLASQYQSYWEHGDAQGISSMYTADGDLIVPTGMVLSGRDMIKLFYTQVLSGAYKGSRVTIDVPQMRSLSADIMLVDGDWSIVGARDKEGKELPAERGVYSLVAVRQNGTWLITALREQTSANSLDTPHMHAH